MLKTLTLILTLCVSGGRTEYDPKCPYPEGSLCECNSNPSSSFIACRGKYNRELTELPQIRQEVKEINSQDVKQGMSAGPFTRLVILLDPYQNITSIRGGSIPPGLEIFTCESCTSLTSISPNAFSGSEKTLTVVKVKNSPMENLLNFQAMFRLEALTTLIWIGGGLVHADFSPDWENSKYPLRNLHLSGNRLTKVPKQLFRLARLTKLVLHNNLITVVGRHDILFPSSLKEIDIGSNKIGKMQTIRFDGDPSLKNLNLAFNPITDISDNAFWYLSKLEDLSLSHHQLRRIPLALKRLTGLKHANLVPKREADFKCTCNQYLAVWFSDVNPNIVGTCMHKNVRVNITQFLTKSAPKAKCVEDKDSDDEIKRDEKGTSSASCAPKAKCVEDKDSDDEIKRDEKGTSSASYPTYNKLVLIFFFYVSVCWYVYFS